MFEHNSINFTQSPKHRHVQVAYKKFSSLNSLKAPVPVKVKFFEKTHPPTIHNNDDNKVKFSEKTHPPTVHLNSLKEIE